MAASAVAILFIAGAALALGFSLTGEAVDPTLVSVSLSRNQWVEVVGVAMLGGIVFATAMAASVHAACEQDPVPVRRAFGLVTAKSMQLFWLQGAVYLLALRLSPWAVPVMWFSVVFGVPVALREDLGPSDAMDRAWALTAGWRIRILALEIVTTGLVLGMISLIGWGILTPHSFFNLNLVPLWARLVAAIPLMAVLLLPVQFLFVALGRGYEMLKRAEAPVLHAKAASSVSSS